MRFQNFTPMPDELLREIIRFVCPPGVNGFDIAFKNSARGYKGRAYTGGTSYHLRADRRGGVYRGHYAPPYVVIGCAKALTARKWTKPYTFTSRGAYLGCGVCSDVEAVVSLVAHELRHLWQKRVKRGHRVWGARGQFSERDADAYAIQMLRQWRRR